MSCEICNDTGMTYGVGGMNMNLAQPCYACKPFPAPVLAEPMALPKPSHRETPQGELVENEMTQSGEARESTATEPTKIRNSRGGESFLLAGNPRNVQHPRDRDAATVATPVAASVETTRNPEATASSPPRSGADNSQPPASEAGVAPAVRPLRHSVNSLADTLDKVLPYPCPESVEQVRENSVALLTFIRRNRKS